MFLCQVCYFFKTAYSLISGTKISNVGESLLSTSIIRTWHS